MISISTAPGSRLLLCGVFVMSGTPRGNDDVAPCVNAGALAGQDDAGAIELVDDGGPAECNLRVEFFALVNRAIE